MRKTWGGKAMTGMEYPPPFLRVNHRIVSEKAGAHRKRLHGIDGMKVKLSDFFFFLLEDSSRLSTGRGNGGMSQDIFPESFGSALTCHSESQAQMLELPLGNCNLAAL